jgi:hypothetical protein
MDVCGSCPTEMIRNFDYGLLKHALVDVRKAAMLSFFVLLKASIHKVPKEDSKVSLVAPLMIKDDILYLALDSGDNGLTRFHLNLKSTLRQMPGYLDQIVFAYCDNYSRDGLLLGVESFTAGARVSLTKCFDSLPDPAVSRVFCRVNHQLKTQLCLQYMRVGGGEEELPSSTSSLSRSCSSESCSELEDRVRINNGGSFKRLSSDNSLLNYSAEIIKESEKNQPDAAPIKFITTGHFDKAVEAVKQHTLIEENKLEQIFSAIEQKKDQARFRIRQRHESLARRKPKMMNPCKPTGEKSTTAGSRSIKENSLCSPKNIVIKQRNKEITQYSTTTTFLHSSYVSQVKPSLIEKNTKRTLHRTPLGTSGDASPSKGFFLKRSKPLHFLTGCQNH